MGQVGSEAKGVGEMEEVGSEVKGGWGRWKRLAVR